MSFSDSIDKFVQGTKKKQELVFRKSSLIIMNQIINGTPVGNPDLWENKELWSELGWVGEGYKGGALRANWQGSINKAASGEVNSTSKSKSDDSAKKTASFANVGDKLFFVNNLPYARPIENGHSKQAPAGMVKVAAANWQGIVKIVARAER